MSTVYLKSGLIFTPTTEEGLDLHKQLPPGNYIIKQNPMTGALYFEQVDSFPTIGKMYGNTTRHAARILSTFQERPSSTGVLLNGEKGSGKTLLAKTLGQDAAKLGMPTIIINTPWHGDQFNQLIAGLKQPAVILFDEFEKVYDREKQEAILTLLDGVFPSKKLFVLTCNDKYRIDAHMRNRPGRIFYMIDFKGLDSAFITEYCEDRLNNKEHIESICKLALLFEEFNFDMLKALVEEMNRYNEDAHQALELLNAKPQSDQGGRFTIHLTVNGKQVQDEDFYPTEYHGSPVGKEEIELTVMAKLRPDQEEYEERDETEIHFQPGDLKNIDLENGAFTFTNKSGATAVFTRKRAAVFNYRGAF